MESFKEKGGKIY